MKIKKEETLCSFQVELSSGTICSWPSREKRKGEGNRWTRGERRVGESNTLLIHVSPFVSRYVGHTRSDLIVHPGGNSCGVGFRRRTN